MGSAGAQPSGTGPRWGSQWSAEGMAAAYDARLPWPDEAVDVVAARWDRRHAVLDVGAGTGRLTVPLAERLGPSVGVVAVEPSAAMLRRGAALTGPNVRWVHSTFEDAGPQLQPPYGLVVCAESVHWLNWSIAFDRLSTLVADEAMLVLLGILESAPGEARPGSPPWLPELLEVIADLSTNDEFVPYDGVAELQRRGYFDEAGRTTTAWVPFAQSPEDVVRRYHSMNGLSPERLGPAATAEFDRRALAAIQPHAADDGLVHVDVAARIHWGCVP